MPVLSRKKRASGKFVTEFQKRRFSGRLFVECLPAWVDITLSNSQCKPNRKKSHPRAAEANSFIFYGKSGEIATNRLEDQEISVLSLHLLQVSLVYVNTLMLQHVLAEPVWLGRLGEIERRALSPLIYAHVNPYGTFKLDMTERLALGAA
jgi:hypothetical protein